MQHQWGPPPTAGTLAPPQDLILGLHYLVLLFLVAWLPGSLSGSGSLKKILPIGIQIRMLESKDFLSSYLPTHLMKIMESPSVYPLF